MGHIRELLAGPPMGNLGDNDEEAADKQIAAREPKVQRGAEQGRRGRKDAKPLMRIDELAPGLRADQIIGMEVRSSDDKWGRSETSSLGRRTAGIMRSSPQAGSSRLERTASSYRSSR